MRPSSRFARQRVGYPTARMGLGATLAHTAAAPVRLSLSAGELALEVALGLVRGTRRALEGDDHLGAARVQPSWPQPPRRTVPSSNGGSERSSTPASPALKPRPEAVEPPPVAPADAQGDAVPVVPPPSGAKEVDDAPVPVAEFAEQGAEDGAGADVHVDPPWDGYDELTAAEIQKRLAKANRGLVAAVALYEGARRGRRSVIRAADRRLRLLSA